MAREDWSDQLDASTAHSLILDSSNAGSCNGPNEFQPAALLSSIGTCRACAGEFGHEPRPVVQVTSETRLLICGQTPGRRVHESGTPFDDPSGDRLRGWLGLDRSTFYGDPRVGVAPMAFCFPGTDPKGGDYPPPPRCAALWRQPLLTLLPKVELILLVGTHAQRWALRDTSKRSMSDTVAAWREYGGTVIPLPHPSWRNTAWVRRNPWFEADLIPDLRARVRVILGGATAVGQPAIS